MVDWEILLSLVKIEFIVYSLSVIGLCFERGRRFLKDWGPFVVLLFVYDVIGYFAERIEYVYVRELYDVEIILFGPFFGGEIPAFWFQNHQTPVMLVLTGLIYSLHMFVPFILVLIIRYVSENKERFRHVSLSFIITSILAFLTFAIFPTAAPWYVDSYGFIQPDKTVGLAESAGGLLVIDQLFDIDMFGPYYERFNADPFAAFPSLHSGFSFFSAFYFITTYKKKSRKVWLFALYPLSVWYSAVYLQHHYIIDLIAGAIYVLMAELLTRFFMRLYYRRLSQKQELQQETEASPLLDELDLELYEDSTNGKIDSSPLMIEKNT